MEVSVGRMTAPGLPRDFTRGQADRTAQAEQGAEGVDCWHKKGAQSLVYVSTPRGKEGQIYIDSFCMHTGGLGAREDEGGALYRPANVEEAVTSL